MKAQPTDTSVFYQIPDAPESYAPGNILTRMVDGLGYRYYWASNELTTADLAYKPSESGKSCLETMEHIYELSVAIETIASGEVCIRPYPVIDLEYEELRHQTLANFWVARNAFLNQTEEEIEKRKVVFQNGENKSEFPFWNFINGQLSDAIYHTGQIVVFRRANGNPINSNVRVFSGVNAK
jgi:hypothetical protein